MATFLFRGGAIGVEIRSRVELFLSCDGINGLSQSYFGMSCGELGEEDLLPASNNVAETW